VTSPPQSILAPALADLADIVGEFRNSSPQNSLSLLQRFTDEIAEEPMSGFLSNTLPTMYFDPRFPLDNLFYQYGETGTYEYLRRITKVTSPQKRKESNKRKLISCLEENSSTFLRVRLETVGVAFQQ
jgi:hypothetical protein